MLVTLGTFNGRGNSNACNLRLQSPHCMTGLCGGSASGKTTVANKIIEQLGVPWVSMLSLDSFYKVRCVLLKLRLLSDCK